MLLRLQLWPFQGSDETEKGIKMYLLQAKIDMWNPLFRCFSLYLAHKTATQKISIPISKGGNSVQ